MTGWKRPDRGGRTRRSKAITLDEFKALTERTLELHAAFLTRLKREAPELATDFRKLSRSQSAVLAAMSMEIRDG